GVRSAFQFPGGNVGTNLSPEEREYVELVTSQVERTVSAASATLRSFAMPPGRKVMLLLSGGWPYDPAQTAPEDKTKPVLDSDIPRAEKLFQPLADTANLLGYTLYPVDVPGLEGQGPDASEQTAPDPTTVNALDTPEREGETSLGYLAQRTGGRAMINALRINALGQAASDTRSFYWLGFSPQRQRNDKPHKVVVEVKKPGLKVRSRSGFLDFSRKSEVTGMVESTLLFGSSPTLGSLPVRVGEIKKAGGGLMEVPLEVAIPSDQITVVPTNGKFVSQLELRIAVIDEDGWTAEIPVIPLDLAGAKAPDPGSHIRYNTSVKLRKKKNDLVVALYDVASGKLISNRVQVHP
nr:VWA domain-containing protein [Thermoanaerobaculia bacterium]